MPRLRAITEYDGPSQLHLVPGANVLGRAHGLALCLTHDSLSRRHAKFTVDNGTVTVEDLGSKNGTQVNGFGIAGAVPLSHGDKVRVGLLEFELDADDPPPAPTGRFAGTNSIGSDTGPPMATLVDLALDGGEAGRFQLMLRVAEELARPMDLGELLHRVLELTSEILDTDRLVLLRHTDPTETSDDGLAPVAALETGARVSATRIWSRAIVKLVLEERAALRFSDTRSDKRLADASSIDDQDIRCAMGAPLIRGDAVLGVLYVDNLAHARAFTDLDLDLLAGVANQAALALHHALIREEREQQAVFSNSLLRFFPPTTVRRLMERDLVDLEPMETEVTVLFSDIANFTALTSNLPPVRVLELLNTYFPRMVAAVQEQEGTVEKYIGDALMAVWGAPFPQPDAADRALKAALAMRRELARVNTELARRGLPQLEVYIGLHSGPVAFGNLGTDDYLQFATVGDTTNVAARVCDQAEAGQILITEATRARLDQTIDLVKVKDAVLKGKEAPVTLWSPR